MLPTWNHPPTSYYPFPNSDPCPLAQYTCHSKPVSLVIKHVEFCLNLTQQRLAERVPLVGQVPLSTMAYMQYKVLFTVNMRAYTVCGNNGMYAIQRGVYCIL